MCGRGGMGRGQATWHVLVLQASASGDTRAVTWRLRQAPAGIDLAHIDHRHPSLPGQLDTWYLELVSIDTIVTSIVTDTGPGQDTARHRGAVILSVVGQLQHAAARLPEDG